MSAVQTAPVTHAPALEWRDSAGLAAKRIAWCFVVATATAWAVSFVVGFRVALTLICVLGLVAAIVGVWLPVLGAFGVTTLCAIDPMARVFLLSGGLWRWNTFNYWLLIAICLFAPCIVRLRDASSRWLMGLVALLALWLLISPNMARGAQDMLGVVVVFGLLPYFARVAPWPEVWYWLGIYTGVLSAAGGLAFFLQRSQLPEINPNAWAFFPLTALFAACVALPFARRHAGGQVGLWLLAIVSAAWTFLSGSRGCMLVAICCLIYMLFATRGIGPRTAALGVALLLGLSIVTAFSEFSDAALHRVNVLLDPRRELTYRTSRRSDLVRAGWQMFQTNPMGVGTGGFGTAYAALGTYEARGDMEARGERASHSAWVKTLVEIGVPGALVFAAFVLSFAVAGLRRRNRDRRLLGLLTTATLAVGFTTTEFQGKGLWFLVATVTVLLYREPRRVARPSTAITGVPQHAGASP
jgi:hypothetical protein